MSLLTHYKKNRPSISPALLKQLGFPGLVNSRDADLGFADLLEKIMFATGLNHIIQVNDCETSGDWADSNDGTLDFTVGSPGVKIGTNCLKIINTAATDNSQYISTAHIDESTRIARRYGKRQTDWTDTKYLGFWVHNIVGGDFGTEGELQVALVCDGVVQTKVKVQAVVDAVHQWFEIDMVAAEWNLKQVEELRFYGSNSNTGDDIYIDDILRYQISYCNKPYYGCSIPIKNGVTITDGQLVRWEINGAIPYAGDGAQITDLGHAYLYHNSTLTGNAKRNRWAIVPGMHLVLLRANEVTIPGEGLITHTDGAKVVGVAQNYEEFTFAKCLEAAGAIHDDIFALLTFGGTWIS